MKINPYKISKVLMIIGIILLCAWFILINVAVMNLIDNQTFIMDNISDIYDMITDVYYHITDLLTMGVLI